MSKESKYKIEYYYEDGDSENPFIEYSTYKPYILKKIGEWSCLSEKTIHWTLFEYDDYDCDKEWLLVCEGTEEYRDNWYEDKVDECGSNCNKCNVKEFDIVEEDRVNCYMDFEDKKIVADWTYSDGRGNYKTKTETVADIKYCPFCGRKL